MKTGYFVVLALTISLGAGFAGCDASPEDSTNADAGSGFREYEVLDVLEYEQSVLEFGRLEGGGIVMTEDAAIGSLSAMDALVKAQGATPLELFLAVAPPDRSVPPELEDDHLRIAEEKGIDPTPRALELPDSDLAFRSDTTWDYLADCDRPDDEAWFDSFWQGQGWSFHQYQRTSAYESSLSSTPLTDTMLAHVCNDGGPSGNKIMWVRRSTPGFSSYNIFGNVTVAAEHRVVFYLWNESPDSRYRLRVVNQTGQSAQPTYSLGITAP